MLALTRLMGPPSAGIPIRTAQRLLYPGTSRRMSSNAAINASAASASSGGAGKSRKFPDEPRVGVGIVALRPSPTVTGETEVRH